MRIQKRSKDCVNEDQREINKDTQKVEETKVRSRGDGDYLMKEVMPTSPR